MKKVLCAVLITAMLLNTSELYSQPAREAKNMSLHTFSIAVSPLTIVEYEPTINVQFIYRLNNRYSAAVEAGRIIKPVNKDDNSYTSDFFHEYTGWRIRPEVRIWKKPSRNTYKNSYFAVQGLIKIAQDHLFYDVQRSTPSGLGYTEAIEQNLHKTVLGLTFLTGREADLFHSKKFYTDIFTGLGLRYKFFKDNIGTNFSKTSEGDFTNKNGIYPTAALGIRIGFRTN